MKNLYLQIKSNKKYLVLLDQMIFSGCSFMTTLLMTRILVLSDFGIYASIVLFIHLLISLLNAIVIQPLQVTISRMENKKAYVSFSYFLLLILVLLVLVIVWLVLNFNIPFFKVYNSIPFEILCIALGFIVHDYLRKLFLASLQIERAFVIDTIVAVIHISFLIIILLNFELSLNYVLIYLGLGYLPSILYGTLSINLCLVSKTRIKNYVKIHYHQAKWLFLTAIVQWWSTNLFVVASGVFLGLEMLGVFRFVQSLFGVLNIALQAFENYVLPQTSKLLYKSRNEAKLYIRKTSQKAAIPFGIILALLFVFSKPIIVLAGGEQYAPYDYVVKGMVILYIFIFISYPIRTGIRALILNKNFFIGYLISFIFSLMFFKYILEKWQLVGVILGLIISQILLNIYWLYVLQKNKFSLWK